MLTTFSFKQRFFFIIFFQLFSILFSFSLKSQNRYKSYDTDLLPATFFKKNRAHLRMLMPNNSVAIFFSNPIRNRSNDVFYEYHQDPNFYYLTGFNEPHSLLIIFKEQQRYRKNFIVDELLFIQKKDSKEELWTGKRMGPKYARINLKINKIISNTLFGKLDLYLNHFNKILLLHDYKDTRNTKNPFDLYSLKHLLNLKLENVKNKIDYSILTKYMSNLREIKTNEEINLIQKAIDITCSAQIKLMKVLRPKMKEYQAEAIVEYVFKSKGAEYTGFPSIHGSGENSCVLHYTTNRKEIHKNDLLVNDIGAEYHNYTADVTRTFPANGKFNQEQSIIYNIVLEAQKKAIKVCKPGINFWMPHQTAKKIINERLEALGIIKNASESAKYFMHGTSHYLGLDVHDPGEFKILKPGNIITVEPGIYIPKGASCDPKWWNIGIRIEDDILITQTGHLNMSKKAPREIKEIESLMSK